MKKLLNVLVIVMLLLTFKDINAYSLSGGYEPIMTKEIKLLEKELSKTRKGRKYISIIEKFIEANANNKEKLGEILDKTQPIVLGGKIIKEETFKIIKYIDTKIALRLLSLIDIENFGNEVNTDISKDTKENKYEKLTIAVIDDKRCSLCQTDAIIKQLEGLTSIQEADFIRKDYSDIGVKEYLLRNDIKALPLFIFSTNNFDTSKDLVEYNEYGQAMPTINEYLSILKSEDYYLNVGATFDPFQERSEDGFLLIDKERLLKLKNNSYIDGDKEAKITWIEYSDLECPYCAKLNNAGTKEDLFEKYGNNINKIYNHFPLGFNQNAQIGAEILECAGKEQGAEAFYNLISKVYSLNDSSKDTLIKVAVELGATKEYINKCLDDGVYTEKVKDQMKKGTELFGITGTPGNVLINNETLEYLIISGAYPTQEFINRIDNLLK